MSNLHTDTHPHTHARTATQQTLSRLAIAIAQCTYSTQSRETFGLENAFECIRILLTKAIAIWWKSKCDDYSIMIAVTWHTINSMRSFTRCNGITNAGTVFTCCNWKCISINWHGQHNRINHEFAGFFSSSLCRSFNFTCSILLCANAHVSQTTSSIHLHRFVTQFDWIKLWIVRKEKFFRNFKSIPNTLMSIQTYIDDGTSDRPKCGESAKERESER